MAIVISGLIWIEKLIYPGGEKDTDISNTRPSVRKADAKADASVIISFRPLKLPTLPTRPCSPTGKY